MAYAFINDASAASDLGRDLRSRARIALDCEAAGFHRYSDRLCLIQITVEEETHILDPLAVDAADPLRPVLEDPDIQVVMHGADFDLRLLDRDLDIQLKGLFDTQAAAALLGERALGLSSLLDRHLDVDLPKKYQRADWARRPLPEDMLEYAAADTRHLGELADLLRERLDRKGRLNWAREEFRELEAIRWEENDSDPVTGVNGAHRLSPREVTALREALAWRDRIARERDRAPFRIVTDDGLLAVLDRRPRTVEELAGTKGLNGRLARSEGAELLARLERVDELPEDALRPYPPRAGNGRTRPSREVEARLRRLKKVRNAEAEALEMDRGTLLSNARMLEIAAESPRNLSELRDMPEIKSWQVDALGEQLLTALES